MHHLIHEGINLIIGYLSLVSLCFFYSITPSLLYGLCLNDHLEVMISSVIFNSFCLGMYLSFG